MSEQVYTNVFENPTMTLAYHDYRKHIPQHTGTYVRQLPKIGRNEACPCGSGKKYKKCCANSKGHTEV